MAAELAREFPDAEITMIPSSGGRFEVHRDGIPIYQKSTLGRHAAKGEVVKLLHASSGT